jgi:predicted DNA-binding transcriptional regulator YafY
MAREASIGKKAKILYLMRILLERTDDSHSITMSEILAALESYGITAERKSIYSDIEVLEQFGLDIIKTQEGGSYTYHVGSRQFELAELKLLVDSIQAAKFITERKSNDLIKKIESLTSDDEAKQLHRQVIVSGRVKSMNESIYYNVDVIHQAIASDVQVNFQYFQWNPDKEMELRHDGKIYKVSPWALLLDNDYYYMVAYDSEAECIKHFRVDKLRKISLTDDKRIGKKEFKAFDVVAYANKMFDMFDGEDEAVTIECENYLAGVMIDRFGKDVNMVRKGKDHFKVKVNVAVSKQFIHWVMSLGDGAKIVAPASVVDEVKSEIKRLTKLYK